MSALKSALSEKLKLIAYKLTKGCSLDILKIFFKYLKNTF